MTDFIYHITTRSAWLAGEKSGSYCPDSLQRDGFIHCSLIGQVLRVANHFYSGQHGLVILKIEPSRLHADLRWEPGTDNADEEFPHIYGPIETAAVMGVYDFEPGREGQFSLPEGLE